MQDLKNVVLTSDEKTIRVFLESRWSEFPSHVQLRLRAALFVDELKRNLKENQEFLDFKQELLDLLDAMAERIEAEGHVGGSR